MKKKDSLSCLNCRKKIPINKKMGTAHRNHCPSCLWSRHLDLAKPGDRKSRCRSLMAPIGLTFKKEGLDKWGRPKQGELMIIHQCRKCSSLSINRIAADDEPIVILAVFEKSQALDQKTKEKIKKENLYLLEEKDKKEIETQLFGKGIIPPV